MVAFRVKNTGALMTVHLELTRQILLFQDQQDIGGLAAQKRIILK